MTTATHSGQMELLGPRPLPFMGWTFQPRLDRQRLTTNLQRVLYEMLDGRWHVLGELRLVGGSAADSRIRDLYRKRHSGGHELPITTRRRKGLERRGCWEYRLAVERLGEHDSRGDVHRDKVREVFE